MSKIVLVSKATDARYEFTSRSEAVNAFAAGGYRWVEEEDTAGPAGGEREQPAVEQQPAGERRALRSRSPQEAQRSEHPSPVPPEVANQPE